MTTPFPYRLEVDWEGDGSYSHPNSDVTDDLVSLQRASRGRNYGHQVYGRTIAGQMEARLRNDAEFYDRFNQGSPLSGLVVPGRLVRFRASTTGETTTLWTGFLDRIETIERRSGRNEVLLRALGPLADLTQREITSPMRTDVTTAAATTAKPVSYTHLTLPTKRIV